MIQTKVTQTLALAGFVPAGKLSHSYRSLLPLLALCLATTAWGQRGSRVPPTVLSGDQQLTPVAPTPASAQYRFISIEIPGATWGGPYFTGAFGINDARLVTGYYYDGSNSHGFAWQGGILHVLDLPGATDTYLSGVNNQGVVIEDYDNGAPYTVTSGTYSFRTKTWTMLPDPPGYSDNASYQINDFGFVVGDAYAPNNVAWIWDPGSQSYSIYAVPGSMQYSTYSGGINDKGQVVGQFQDTSGVWHGFLEEGGTYTTIDPPDSTYTYPSEINNSSTIVGSWNNLSGWSEGFVRTSTGGFTVVNFPGGLETQIFGINNRGDICGVWVDPNTGFWTPFVAYKK